MWGYAIIWQLKHAATRSYALLRSKKAVSMQSPLSRASCHLFPRSASCVTVEWGSAKREGEGVCAQRPLCFHHWGSSFLVVASGFAHTRPLSTAVHFPTFDPLRWGFQEIRVLYKHTLQVKGSAEVERFGLLYPHKKNLLFHLFNFGASLESWGRYWNVTVLNPSLHPSVLRPTLTCPVLNLLANVRLLGWRKSSARKCFEDMFVDHRTIFE